MPTSRLKVSVVIPAYNAARWLQETLRSVIDQQIPNLQVIVVDDGSSDNTTEIAKNVLSNSQLEYSIIRIENSGASHARNVGWQQAQGEWIQFLDADDLLAPGKLALQMRAAESVSEDCAGIYSGWQRFGYREKEGWHLYGDLVSPEITDPAVDFLKSGNFIQLGALLLRRLWIDHVGGFHESMKVVQDVNLLLRIALAGGRFFHVVSNAASLYYRQTEASLSKAHQREFIRDCLQNANEVRRWIEDKQSMTEYRRQVLLHAYEFVARSSFQHDQETFGAAYAALKQLSSGGNYIPSAPAHLAFASKIIGYPNAEKVAILYRSIKLMIK